MIGKSIKGILLGLLWMANAQAWVWNNPNPDGTQQNTRYLPFIESPKTLDPARSYSAEEHIIIAQIYEPPLQYHYLRRPYMLVPLTATNMPIVTYYDRHHQKLSSDVNEKQVAYTVYDMTIQPNIYYQPHPALAKNQQGEYIYLNLDKKILRHIKTLNDFPLTGSRELTADDYVYEIKRLGSPKTQSPIFGLMSKYIVGLDSYSDRLEQAIKKSPSTNFLDLRKYPLAGAEVIDRYHYRITIKGVYPQFKYWLAMMFFSPIPWEADAFYSQPGLINKNVTLDSYPVGTGPYMLINNNPNKAIVLLRNPNFHHEFYPHVGEIGDKEKGYLSDAGKPLPFIDQIVFILDKESIPRWNKFLQGYYDKSGISPEGFDYAIKIDPHGNPYLTPQLKKLGVTLQTTVAPGEFYFGFNMLDPVVGGYSEKQQKLRQAIGIVLNIEEFISIFMNGRGIPAQGPIPPGIFGYQKGAAGINPYMYTWENNQPKRLSLNDAKQLLAEAGYPNGIDPKTGQPLILNYDAVTSGNPDDKAQFDWMRKQFAKLGIQLNIRATLYSRFRDRVRTGQAQIFFWGWMADYPDPENFLFLLYSPNGMVKYGGENTTNYDNPEVDKLFEEIRLLPDGSLRQQKINQLLAIVRKDSPWIWGFYPIEFSLSHQWNKPSKPNSIGLNIVKYEQINVPQRAELQRAWNPPVLWPFIIFFVIIIIIFLPLVISYWRRENRPTVKKMKE